MDLDVAARPRIRRLFWHLTLLWGAVGLVKGGVGTGCSVPVAVDFVLTKNIVVISLTVCAVGVTVRASTYVARREGLMGRALPALVDFAGLPPAPSPTMQDTVTSTTDQTDARAATDVTREATRRRTFA
jgi:Ni,Fe-hydrogenase III small subunit